MISVMNRNGIEREREKRLVYMITLQFSKWRWLAHSTHISLHACTTLTLLMLKCLWKSELIRLNFQHLYWNDLLVWKFKYLSYVRSCSNLLKVYVQKHTHKVIICTTNTPQRDKEDDLQKKLYSKCFQ